eukprot:2138111-Rhodomonas_salina.2
MMMIIMIIVMSGLRHSGLRVKPTASSWWALSTFRTNSFKSKYGWSSPQCRKWLGSARSC